MHTRSLEVAAEHDAGGPPERSLEQRRAALARANAIRSARARLKVELKAAGTVGIALALDVLESPDAIARELGEPPGVFDTMRLGELLLAVQHVGARRVGIIAARVRVSLSKAVGTLTARQREEVAGELHAIAAVRGWPVNRPLQNLTERTAA